MTTNLRRKHRDLLALLFAQPTGVEPHYYNGSGRWTRKGPDYVQQLAALLSERGLVKGRHYQTGNRAPRGGYEGDFIRLLPAGRRLKAIRLLQREVGDRTGESSFRRLCRCHGVEHASSRRS